MVTKKWLCARKSCTVFKAYILHIHVVGAFSSIPCMHIPAGSNNTYGDWDRENGLKGRLEPILPTVPQSGFELGPKTETIQP